jgi:hypothetical protein
MNCARQLKTPLVALVLAIFLWPALDRPDVWAQQADDASIKSIRAVRVTSPAKIDGLLDEPFWQTAPCSGDFIQHEPDDGKAPSESTSVRVAYDNEAIYVGMEMFDSEPGKIVCRLTRRDRDQNADGAGVIIDSYHDHQTGYGFYVYASGTQQDIYFFGDTGSDAGWDAVWESATKVTDRGWTAEMRIPLDCLRFTAADDADWGILFVREITRLNEFDQWVNIPESAGGYVSKFGHLTGLESVRAPSRLEVLPYAVCYGETEAKRLGNTDGRDYFGNAGLDLKYGITPNITLSGTANPDFGQVEADETVLNLSTFETYFPEKRPFFLEGSRIFSTYFELFYSRRIGKAPSGRIPAAAYFLDRPGATTILGAAKVTGKTKGGTSMGLVESVTQREQASFVDFDGLRREGTVEPEANYFVGRLEQDVLRNSTVGVMVTAANQHTLSPAYSGGADWSLHFHGGDYSTMGQVVGSLTDRDRRGSGAFVQISKDGGQHVRANVSAQYMDRKLDLNRLGFLRRNDVKEFSGWAQYRTTKKWWLVHKTWNAVYVDRTENLSGLKQNYGCDIDCSAQMANYWTIDAGGWTDFGRTYFDWETRGGPPVPVPVGRSWHLGFTTDRRKPWEASSSLGGGDTWDGHFNSYEFAVALRPRSNLEFSFAPELRTEWHVSRWLKAVTDQDGHRQDIFGEQSSHRLNMTFRGTLTFTRDLSLQLYAQPFMAAVDYRRFKRLVPPNSYEEVGADVYDPAVEQSSFNWDAFNSNVVLRWEYRPGSTVFLVWTQAREDFGNSGAFEFDRELRDMFGTIPGNTFLIKVNYRLST